MKIIVVVIIIGFCAMVGAPYLSSESKEALERAPYLNKKACEYMTGQLGYCDEK